ASGTALTRANGRPIPTFADLALTNISSRRPSLAGYNDWAHIQYNVRDTPFFADGSSPVADDDDEPELTASDVIATAEAFAKVPDAPTNVHATVNGSQVTVTWTAPADHGSAISAYDVSVSSGAKTVTVSGTQTHATVAGLPAGRYTFRVRAKNAIGSGAWSLPSNAITIVARAGYWMVGADGHVYPFGNAGRFGNASGPAVAIATRRDGGGYWTTDAAGNVNSFGAAHPHGGQPTLEPGERVSTIAATPSGNGYWLFTNQGHAHAYGDAHLYGDLNGVHLNGPIIASVATPTGHGYYMVASDGGVFGFGDAHFHGSTGNLRLNKPIVGIAPTPTNRGYWLVASDGGVFAFGAPFRGSLGGLHLSQPVNGLVAYGNGYLMVASDGGVFDFSNKPFAGSLANTPPTAPIIGIAAFTTT
ncbi:MAG TPA: fibronectin type III domain-containing protein, partial [Acidimicrobiia bacterium]|nr:fibronectin type III domain-containing protein [Acidimicrobiia bacterium]